jgi:fucose permease
MSLRDWVDLDAIQTISRHTSGVLAAVLAFIIVGAVIEVGLHEGCLKQILQSIDGFVLVGLFCWLVYRLAWERVRGPHCFVVA